MSGRHQLLALLLVSLSLYLYLSAGRNDRMEICSGLHVQAARIIKVQSKEQSLLKAVCFLSVCPGEGETAI